MQRKDKEPIEIKCPRCDHTEIIYLPKDDYPLRDDFPKCPKCKVDMIIKELLDEGKSY